MFCFVSLHDQLYSLAVKKNNNYNSCLLSSIGEIWREHLHVNANLIARNKADVLLEYSGHVHNTKKI
jgi:hypothetical protein